MGNRGLKTKPSSAPPAFNPPPSEDDFLASLFESLESEKAAIADKAANWQTEILDSAVSRGILENNFYYIEGEEALELIISAALANCDEPWKEQSLRERYATLESGGWAVQGLDPLNSWERSEWGQMKPFNPRPKTKKNDKGKWEKAEGHIKYETPASQPTRILYLSPTVEDVVSFCLTNRLALYETFSAIAQHQSKLDSAHPLLDAIAQGATNFTDWCVDNGAVKLRGFWPWAAANPSLPRYITEGAKTGGAMLTAGLLTICLPGVWNGRRKKDDGKLYLHPDLAVMLAQPAPVIMAFDQDMAKKTRKGVGAALIELGGILATQHGCDVSVARWDGKLGKGADDFIAAQGAEAFHHAIAQPTSLKDFEQAYREEFPQTGQKRDRTAWAKGQRKKFSFLYGMEAEDSYAAARCRDLDLPAPGNILAVDSPTGSGKTYQLARIKSEFFAKHSTGLLDVLGYRNMLGAQTASKTGIDHIHAHAPKSGDKKIEATWVNSRDALSYCLDSLFRRKKAVLESAEKGRGVCLVFDELDACVNHLLKGGTLKTLRHKVITALAEVVFATLANGGYVIGLEHNLTQVSCDFIKAIAPASAQVEKILNKGLARKDKRVIFHYPLNLSGQDSDKLMRRAYYQKILELHNDGVRMLIVDDGQEGLEIAQALIENEGGCMRRVDSTTANDERDFMADPAPGLEQGKAKNEHVGLTTTAESGIDFPQGHFDAVVLYGSHIAPRALYQMQNRERGDVPVYAFVPSKAIFSESIEESDLDVDSIIKANRSLAGVAAAAMLAPGQSRGDMASAAYLIQNSYSGAVPLAATVQKFIALYEIRERLGKADLRGELIEICEKSGFTIETEDCLGHYISEGESADLTKAIDAAKEKVHERSCLRYLSQDVRTMTVEQARLTKQEGTGDRASQTLASKVLLADKLPGMPLNNANFVMSEIVQAKGRNLKKHELIWLTCNLDVARRLDAHAWDKAKDNLWVVAHELPRISAQVAMLERSGLGKLLKLKEHHSQTPEKIAVQEFLVKHAPLMRGLFGYKFSADHSPSVDVNKFLKGLGFVVTELRKVGGAGEQIRVYGHKATDTAGEVWAAMSRKWAEAEGISPQNPANTYVLGKPQNTIGAILQTERVSLNHDYCTKSPYAGGGAAAQNAPPNPQIGEGRSQDELQLTLT